MASNRPSSSPAQSACTAPVRTPGQSHIQMELAQFWLATAQNKMMQFEHHLIEIKHPLTEQPSRVYYIYYGYIYAR